MAVRISHATMDRWARERRKLEAQRDRLASALRAMLEADASCAALNDVDETCECEVCVEARAALASLEPEPDLPEAA